LNSKDGLTQGTPVGAVKGSGLDVGGFGDGDITLYRIHRRYLGVILAEQFHVKADVGTRTAGLMNLNGNCSGNSQKVCSCPE